MNDWNDPEFETETDKLKKKLSEAKNNIWWIECYLFSACRRLTREQMIGVGPKDQGGSFDLLELYVNHLKEQYKDNHDKRTLDDLLKELNRVS